MTEPYNADPRRRYSQYRAVGVYTAGQQWHDGRHRHDGYPAKRRRADRSRWHWLLLLVVILPLATPLYNRTEPQLFGLPFFYWCQLAFAVLSSMVLLVVHLATKGRGHG